MAAPILQDQLDILFIVTGLSLGGAEIQVVELALTHASAGRKVGVMSMVSNGTKLKTRLIDAGVPLWELGMARGRPSWRAFLAAARIVKAAQPRIVHAHMFHSNIMARLLRAVCSMPVLVCTAHNSNEGGWLSMAMYRATNRLGDVLTNVSGLAARELERRGAAPKGTIVTVWNGIDTVRFAPDSGSRKFLRDQMAVKEDAFVFLAAGRLAAQKAYPDLLHALRIALQRNPRIQLVVAGEGELAEDLRGLASSLGIGDRVTWLGVRDDIDCLMKAADAFVLSSEYEGFGLVVAEAMSSALPVVATCCNGPEEVIGEEGLLVPVRNPGALADAMARVAGMSVQERAHIGNSARTRVVERFSLAAAARNWIDLYRAQGAAPW